MRITTGFWGLYISLSNYINYAFLIIQNADICMPKDVINSQVYT